MCAIVILETAEKEGFLVTQKKERKKQRKKERKKEKHSEYQSIDKKLFLKRSKNRRHLTNEILPQLLCKYSNARICSGNT